MADANPGVKGVGFQTETLPAGMELVGSAIRPCDRPRIIRQSRGTPAGPCARRKGAA